MIRQLVSRFGLILLLAGCASGEQENMQDLTEVAEVINKKCPQMLDSETRLEGIGVKEPNTLVYRYTLVHLLAEKIDTVQFYRALWPGIISNIKVSPEMKRLREANTNMEYFYQDKNQKHIYTFHITPGDYKTN